MYASKSNTLRVYSFEETIRRISNVIKIGNFYHIHLDKIRLIHRGGSFVLNPSGLLADPESAWKTFLRKGSSLHQIVAGESDRRVLIINSSLLPSYQFWSSIKRAKRPSKVESEFWWINLSSCVEIIRKDCPALACSEYGTRQKTPWNALCLECQMDHKPQNRMQLIKIINFGYVWVKHQAKQNSSRLPRKMLQRRSLPWVSSVASLIAELINPTWITAQIKLKISFSPGSSLEFLSILLSRNPPNPANPENPSKSNCNETTCSCFHCFSAKRGNLFLYFHLYRFICFFIRSFQDASTILMCNDFRS